VQSKFKVLHIITNLDQGGAERQLLELLENHEDVQKVHSNFEVE